MNNPKTFEELVKEWSPKNPGSLSDYTRGSNKIMLWICPAGHEYSSRIKRRYIGDGCPYCSGRIPVKGENDLQAPYPQVAAEWHPTKNGEFTPDMFRPGSHYRAWWLCPVCGHEWPNRIYSRTAGEKCPVCTGKKHGVTKRNLAVDRPDIAAEWDTEKNSLTPYDVTINYDAQVWWRCNRRHEWTASVHSRTKPGRPNKCPYCAGKRAIPGETDLATTDPEIAAEWSDINILKPTEVLRCSHKKVYWNCPKGHIYSATVANRTNGKGCPCNRNRIPKDIF